LTKHRKGSKMVFDTIFGGVTMEKEEEKKARKTVKSGLYVKHTLTLAERISDMLVSLATEKGIAKSAVVAIAVERYFREEEARNAR